MRLPRDPADPGAGGSPREEWLDRLPRLVRALLEEWGLAGDGEPWPGDRSLLVPVSADGEPAVLKVGFPRPGSEHEHLALQHWHGHGAVRLLRADPRRGALLLERLGEDLSAWWDGEACEVLAGLYPRLHVPAPPQLARLSTLVETWDGWFADLPRGAPVPHRLVEHARALARGFVTDPATDGVLLHGDLHAGTVLTTARERALAVAPRPLSGDPHLEPAAALRHGWSEVVASGDVRATVRRRFHTLVDAGGLDEDRARDWVVVREVAAAVAELERPRPDRTAVTASVTVAKAVQV